MKSVLRHAALLLLLVLLTSACAPTNQPQSKSLLQITSMVASLGGEGANDEVGVYSYTIILTNRSGLVANVKSVTPEIPQAFAARLITSNNEIAVEKAVPSGESIEINGKLRFDFKNLSKEQITKMGEPVAGFDVVSQSYLPLPPLE